MESKLTAQESETMKRESNLMGVEDRLLEKRRKSRERG
jgi:hypothetical protein